MAVRTPKSAPSGNPPRSGSAATLRTEKASGTYARRLSMVWTYRNDPRCHWLRSRRPQGIGTESVYAACLLYLFLATISRLTPPYLRNPTAEAGLVRSLRQGGFFLGGGLRSVNAALPRTLRHIIGKTKCDGIQNQMRLFGGRVSPKRKATKISHTHTKKHRSNGF